MITSKICKTISDNVGRKIQFFCFTWLSLKQRIAATENNCLFYSDMETCCWNVSFQLIKEGLNQLGLPLRVKLHYF